MSQISHTDDFTGLVQQNPDLLAQGQQELTDVLTRSATDMTFRQRLLEDPAAAIEEATGRPFQHPFNIAFIENKADATIVLPDVASPAAELSEEELEMVAGGVSSDPLTVASVLTIAASVMTIAATIGYIVND